MSEPVVGRIAAPLDSRFPSMPEEMLPMPTQPRPTHRTKYQPVNGPPIEDWETALLGRQLIKEEAAYTRGQDGENSGSVKGVRGALMFCVRNAEGALRRVPVEIVGKI